MRWTNDAQIDADGALAEAEHRQSPSGWIHISRDGGPYPSLRFRRPRSPSPLTFGVAALLALVEEYDDKLGHDAPIPRVRRREVAAAAAAELVVERMDRWENDRALYWTERHGYQVALLARGTLYVRRVDVGYWPLEFAGHAPNPRALCHPQWRIRRGGDIAYWHAGVW